MISNKGKKFYFIFDEKIIKSLLIILLIFFLTTIKKKKMKIGIIGVRHDHNIGATLLKYAISIILSELGFEPFIIGSHYRNYDISFLKRNTNLIVINNSFSEIKKDDYDILMVNSDQTWRKFDKFFYDHAFLNFAKNWNIPKFVYGASLGYNYWTLTKDDEKVSKNLLRNFKGISVREKGSIELIKKHLGIKATLVIDPTLLIDKKYYLDLVNVSKNKINIKNNYIFIYSLKKTRNMRIFINNAAKRLKYSIYYIKMNKKYSIENFIYGIINSKAVITNSYHGTIFSIIFNKPFVTFIFKGSPKERFLSLKETFRIDNRFIENNKQPNIDLLTKPLNLNYTLIKFLRNQSIKYLKKNLGLS